MAKVKGNSRYFSRKYGTPNPEFIIEGKEDFHVHSHTAAGLLYLGRALAEGLPLDGNTLYGHIDGFGEFVHETEIDL